MNTRKVQAFAGWLQMLQEVLYRCFELIVSTLSSLQLWTMNISFGDPFLSVKSLLSLPCFSAFLSATSLSVDLGLLPYTSQFSVCFPKSFCICDHKWSFLARLFLRAFLMAWCSKSERSELLSSMSLSADPPPVPTLLSFDLPKITNLLLPNFSSFPFTRPFSSCPTLTTICQALCSFLSPHIMVFLFWVLSSCSWSAWLLILSGNLALSYQWNMRGAFLFFLVSWMIHLLLQSSPCLALLYYPPHPIPVSDWKMCSLGAFSQAGFPTLPYSPHSASSVGHYSRFLYSRPGWMGLEAAWFIEKCPCPRQGIAMR